MFQNQIFGCHWVPRGSKWNEKTNNFLSSCTAQTRLGPGAVNVEWLRTKPAFPLFYAKPSQKLDRSLNVLSWGLLPILPSAVLNGCLTVHVFVPPVRSQMFRRSVNLAGTSGQQGSHFASFPSASWGTEKQMARQGVQLIHGEIVFSDGRFCLLAVCRGNTIICFCQCF